MPDVIDSISHGMELRCASRRSLCTFMMSLQFVVYILRCPIMSWLGLLSSDASGAAMASYVEEQKNSPLGIYWDKCCCFLGIAAV